MHSQSGIIVASAAIALYPLFYIIMRRVGQLKAEEAPLLLEQLPVDVISLDKGQVKEAVRIK